ncbi:IclR family transcriptional regulator [Sinomonas cyclohexanicum]|uniref:IclR family transcriptional regulator n=1 Tax=Sinomonas cyclohexanicum TaxID=322009 RepID=A0ABM7PSH7_SINCY|nr:IclR family transcriptional regulator [Corynebacterium cyclohexanicum]BCT75169.1 IclR family transcriptional regulator [Corynebacterium cyclohexanicum]
MANSPSGDSMVHRIVRIIEAFDGEHRTLSAAELARRADLPTSTAYRIFDELLAESLLDRDGRRLRLGTRLWELVSRGSKVLGLREAALPFMEDVQAVVGHHTVLGILEKNEVLYIERIGSNESTINITRVAGRLPIHATSTGLVLTAFGPAEDQEILLHRRLKRYTDTTTIDPDELRRKLAEVRRMGYSVMAGTIVPESTGVAVPIFNAEGTAIAGLSVVIPRAGGPLQTSITALQTAARGISRALGWDGTLRDAIRRSL